MSLRSISPTVPSLRSQTLPRALNPCPAAILRRNRTLRRVSTTTPLRVPAPKRHAIQKATKTTLKIYLQICSSYARQPPKSAVTSNKNTTFRRIRKQATGRTVRSARTEEFKRVKRFQGRNSETRISASCPSFSFGAQRSEESLAENCAFDQNSFFASLRMTEGVVRMTGNLSRAAYIGVLGVLRELRYAAMSYILFHLPLNS